MACHWQGADSITCTVTSKPFLAKFRETVTLTVKTLESFETTLLMMINWMLALLHTQKMLMWILGKE